MRRTRSRGQRIRRKNVAGIAILILVVVTLGAAAILAIITIRPPRDETTNCTPAGPRAITVIAIDATDVLNEVQRLALRNELTKVVDGLNEDDGVQVWRIAPSSNAVPDAAGPLLCHPGRTANRWFQNQRFVEKAYSDNFRTPIISQLDRFVEASAAPQSPIMESIQAIAIRTFGLSKYASVKDRVLLLASDMIQNTATHSQVRGISAFPQFQASAGYRAVSSQLTGVRVQVLYLQRPTSIGYKEHVEFWQQYFAASGAQLDRVLPIAGLSTIAKVN